MKEKFLYYVFYLIPKNYLSYFFGKIASLKKPKCVVQFIIKKFSKFYKIDVNEASKPIEEYETLCDFFIRDLKDGLRACCSDFVSPVDAYLRNVGEIKDFKMEVVKGKNYDVASLIGEPLPSSFSDGFFVNLYLSPHNYHNVHSPVSGKLKSIKYIKGALWPVTNWSLNTVQDLFLVNERLVFNIESQYGNMYLVMVGATNVGKMKTKFLENFSTNNIFSNKDIQDFVINKDINIMEKIGSFCLGSTVVMILERGYESKIGLKNKGDRKVGEKI